MGKTVLAKSLARSLHLSFSRLQFTPDLLPTDVTGVNVFSQKTNEFEFRPGPVFTNVLLVDEINRASPKTQSALLEAMQEYQVTIDGATYALELPVPRRRDAEPDRVRGHVSASRSAARPLHARGSRSGIRRSPRRRGCSRSRRPTRRSSIWTRSRAARTSSVRSRPRAPCTSRRASGAMSSAAPSHAREPAARARARARGRESRSCAWRRRAPSREAATTSSRRTCSRSRSRCSSTG